MKQVTERFLCPLPSIVQLRTEGFGLAFRAGSLSESSNQFVICDILTGSKIPEELGRSLLERAAQVVGLVIVRPSVMPSADFELRQECLQRPGPIEFARFHRSRSTPQHTSETLQESLRQG